MRWVCLLIVCGAGLLPAQEPAQGNPKDRVKAARALGKQGTAGIDGLSAMLADTAPEVRKAAVEALVAIGGPRSLDPLTLALADSEGEIQALAADGLVNFYLPGYVQTGWKALLKKGADQFLDYFTEADEPVTPGHVTARPKIVEALGRVVATSPSFTARATAARALGVLRAKPASEQLLAALATKNTEVLYEVLIALEKIRNPEVAPRLFYLLRDPDEKVQLAAIQTVSVLGNRDANAPLREAWERSRNDRVRRALLQAMAMLPDESNRGLFDRYLLDADEELRAAAAEGLGRLGNLEDRARLETLWEGERKMRPRLALAFAVVALGNKEISELSPLQYLINTLNHVAWKQVAQAFLKDLAPDAVVRFSLHNAVLSGSRDEKILLTSVLGARGGKDSVEPLETLSHDGDVEVATESLRALRTLRLRLR